MEMIFIKRFTALFMALVLTVLLAGCGGASAVSQPDSRPVSSSQQPPPQSRTEPEPTPPVELEPLPPADGVDALTGLAPAEGLAAGQRPVAVAVSNNPLSLPQRGLAAADVMVEMLTEGGITRLLALYSDYRTLPQVGPVRSTRDQFVQFALPIDAIQVHIGTSITAHNLLEVTGTRTVDGILLGNTAFWFDEQRPLPRGEGKPNEYCWFTNAELVWNGMTYVDVMPTGAVSQLFRFGQGDVPQNSDGGTVSVAYSSDAWCGFTYNTETGRYDKSIFGNPHMDEDGTLIAFDNLLLLSCNIGLKPGGVLAEFDFMGGEGLYFTGGGVRTLQWFKGGPLDPLRLIDEDGSELEIRPGKSYIGFVPADTDAVSYGPL